MLFCVPAVGYLLVGRCAGGAEGSVEVPGTAGRREKGQCRPEERICMRGPAVGEPSVGRFCTREPAVGKPSVGRFCTRGPAVWEPSVGRFWPSSGPVLA